MVSFPFYPINPLARTAFLGYTLSIDNKIMKKLGQSIIEYILIAVLVILGIVIMGTYVLRSTNAHFKLWDEGIQDSYTENLNQAPVNDVPYISSNCTYTDNNAGCGSGLAGSQCGVTQRIVNHNSSPQGCDGEPASYCVNDPSCCNTPVSGNCGTMPIPSTGLPAGGACKSSSEGNNICTPASAADPSNCYYGQRIWGYQCGPNTSIQCVKDSTCDPQCLGILSPDAAYCGSGTITPPTNLPPNYPLTQNYGISYVVTQAECAGAPPCALYCKNDVDSVTGTGCTYAFTVAPDPTVAPCLTSKGCVPSTSGYDTICTCNFQMCVGVQGTIRAVSEAAVPTGGQQTSGFTQTELDSGGRINIPPGSGEDGCQNPSASGDEGEPNTTCQASAFY
jgi:hypothetical protein